MPAVRTGLSVVIHTTVMRNRRTALSTSIRNGAPALLRGLAPSPTSIGSARLLLNHRDKSEVCRDLQQRDEQLPLPATYTASLRQPFGASILLASTPKSLVPNSSFSPSLNTSGLSSSSPTAVGHAIRFSPKPLFLERRAFSTSSPTMAATKIDGTAIAKKIRETLHAEIAEKQQANPRYQPSLKIVQGTCCAAPPPACSSLYTVVGGQLQGQET